MMHHIAGPDCLSCNNKLELVHAELVAWFKDVKLDFPNAHVAWGFRGKEDQEKAFQEGRTRLHYPNSKHNLIPSQAVDIFQIDEQGLAVFDPIFYTKVAEQLPLFIEWAGKWTKFKELDHYEIVSQEHAPLVA